MLRKFGADEPAIQKLIGSFYQKYVVIDVHQAIIMEASILRTQYHVSFWDGLIVSSALYAGATRLYSEDMQDGLVVNGQLTIRNPFKASAQHCALADCWSGRQRRRECFPNTVLGGKPFLLYNAGIKISCILLQTFHDVEASMIYIVRRLMMLALVVPVATACTLRQDHTNSDLPPSPSTQVLRPSASSTSSTPPHHHHYTNTLSTALTMQVPRAAHSATLLSDGQVLIAGGFRTEGTNEIAIASAELYDPATDAFQEIGPMTEPRSGHTATLLPSGEVLVVGGWGPQQRIATAELYNPQTRRFRAVGSLATPRASMTATLLPDGQVIIIGGDSARNTPQLIAEEYNPDTQTFTASGSLSVGRSAHTATLLQDGTVLVAGGSAGSDHVLASAEIYYPKTKTFKATGSMYQVRYKHAAVALPTGHVLLIGGSNQNDWTGKYRSTEEYDPASGTFRQAASLADERFKLPDGVVLLTNGNVLVGSGNAQMEIYNTTKEQFQPSSRLDTTYYYTVLTLLQDGRVLLTGGYDSGIRPTTKAWIYS